MGLRLPVATARRRLAAASIDALCCGLLAALPYLIGLFSVDHFTPPDDRFWPDHLLVMLAEQPRLIWSPMLWSLVIWCGWQFGWVYFGDGRTPGGRLFGIRIVDGLGDRVGWAGSAARAAGHAISALTVGLGWLWALVSRERRTWPDIFSDTYAVRRR